ncbi:hypothetical protein ACWCPD_39765 [Streptomyces sp. NPDC001935]
MPTDANQNPAHPSAPNPRRASAQEVIQLVIEQQQLTDDDFEIDFEALARLDDMPEAEAVALIDSTMARIMFS